MLERVCISSLAFADSQDDPVVEHMPALLCCLANLFRPIDTIQIMD